MKVKLGEIATIKGGKRMPKGTNLQIKKNEHPYLRITDFDNGRFNMNSLKYVPQDVFQKISSYTISKNDIFLSIVGTIGLVALVNKELDGASLTENAVKIVPKSKVDNQYLAYYLQSFRGKSQIDALSVGSTQKKLPIKNIKKLEIELPKYSEQCSISHKLAILDKKIELNNEINANLQELRHILYKQLIAQSALKTISIKELYSIKYGKTLPKSQLLRTGTKVFGAKGFMGYTERKPLVNKATVTITSRGSGAGFVSYIDEEEAFLTNNLLYLIDKTGLGLSFTYELIKSSKPSQFVTGSAQPQLTINNLKQLKLKIPTDRFIIEQFKNNTKRIEDCMSNNKIENNSLQKLRLAFLNYYF